MTTLKTTYITPEDKKRIQIEQAQRGLKAENEVITLALDALEVHGVVSGLEQTINQSKLEAV